MRCVNGQQGVGVGDMENRIFDGVHDSRCCQIHGCKYGEDDCPVVAKRLPGIRCEECEHEFPPSYKFNIEAPPYDLED
jgi:hypothetical protein